MEMGDNPLANRRKGIKEISGRVEEDTEKQQALHHGKDQRVGCIVLELVG